MKIYKGGENKFSYHASLLKKFLFDLYILKWDKYDQNVFHKLFELMTFDLKVYRGPLFMIDAL